MNLKNTLTLKIDSLSYSGGRGVGRVDGMVVFVPNAAPGDVIQARVTARKPRFLEAEIVEIVEPSPSRREPPCPVAGRCGGCSWQHINYEAQLEQKKKILKDSLKKLERSSPFEWREWIPAPAEFYYRNRVQLQLRDRKYGFFGKGSHDFVPVEQCWIADPRINQRLKQLSAQDLSASRLEVAVRPDGETALMAEKRDADEALFAQVNTAQNENLLRAMIETLRIEPKWIYDLYCGSGNLTQSLAARYPGASILGADLCRASIARAPKLPKVEFVAGDVARVLRRPVQSGFGLVVVDPPRAGCDAAVVKEILRHSPQQIVYVSCNPTTFARDAERLLSGKSYKLKSVQGLDMFPQTEHIELIASFCAAT